VRKRLEFEIIKGTKTGFTKTSMFAYARGKIYDVYVSDILDNATVFLGVFRAIVDGDKLIRLVLASVEDDEFKIVTVSDIDEYESIIRAYSDYIEEKRNLWLEQKLDCEEG
jgi:hypothetical protein